MTGLNILFESATHRAESIGTVCNEEPSYGSVITSAAFRQRLTFDERVAIELAAETDATVRVWKTDLESVTRRDLASPDTVEFLQIVVERGLVTQLRATDILTAPVQQSEVA